MEKLQNTFFYSYINGKELLLESIESVREVFPKIIVVNNSGLELEISGVEVLEPSVPLSFAQVMNLFGKIAYERDQDYWLWGHTDMESPEGVASKFKYFIEENFEKEWCTAWTSYDIMSAFHTLNYQKIGGCDWKLFPNYFCDNDLYRRIEINGLQILKSGLEVVHKNGGSYTIRQGDIWQKQHDINFPLHAQAYAKKWGGDPGKETFLTPYNI
jgi:hypothetical protein